MADVANVYDANLQVVRPGRVPELFEMLKDGTLYKKIAKAGEKHKISKTEASAGKDFRIPVQVAPPGQFGVLNMNGGAFAPGNSAIVKQMYQQYFTTQMALKLTEEEIRSTNGNDLSKFPAWRENMRQSLPAFINRLDSGFHNITGAQGLIGLATAVSSAGTAAGDYTYTFDYEFGPNLLQEMQPVEIFSNDLLTHKTTGLTIGDLPYVHSINHAAKTAVVTVQAGHTLGTATAATDYLGIAGVGATPVYQNGLYYFMSTLTSGNLLGLSRSTYPQLQVPKVNANGALTTLHGYLLKSYMRQRTGEYPKKLKGVITDAEAYAIVKMGIGVQQLLRKHQDEAIDPTLSYDNNITYCDVDHMIDIHASRKRIEWLDLDTWLRVYADKGEPDFYRASGSGQMVFQARDSSAQPTTAVQFFLSAQENFACTLPAKNGFIYGLIPETDFQ